MDYQENQKERYETECKKYLALRSSMSELADSERNPEMRNKYLAMKADFAHQYLISRQGLEKCNKAEIVDQSFAPEHEAVLVAVD